jgi:hypothetical protein
LTDGKLVGVTASWTGSLRNFSLRRWGSASADDPGTGKPGSTTTDDGDFVSTAPGPDAAAAAAKPEDAEPSTPRAPPRYRGAVGSHAGAMPLYYSPGH